MHICDIFHLHIEGVLSRRALAGRRNLGRSGQGWRWTMAATLLETVLAATSHVTSAPWPDCLRSSLGSSVHNFCFYITLFCCPHTFVFAFLHNGRLMTSKQTKSTPEGHLMCWRECVPQWPTTWPFVCVLYLVCMCERMTNDECVGLRVC